jgi:hypothetical protein
MNLKGLSWRLIIVCGIDYIQRFMESITGALLQDAIGGMKYYSRSLSYTRTFKSNLCQTIQGR